jgi:hypothetical protein
MVVQHQRVNLPDSVVVAAAATSSHQLCLPWLLLVQELLLLDLPVPLPRRLEVLPEEQESLQAQEATRQAYLEIVRMRDKWCLCPACRLTRTRMLLQLCPPPNNNSKL